MNPTNGTMAALTSVIHFDIFKYSLLKLFTDLMSHKVDAPCRPTPDACPWMGQISILQEHTLTESQYADGRHASTDLLAPDWAHAALPIMCLADDIDAWRTSLSACAAWEFY